jgi:hypothetical protein
MPKGEKLRPKQLDQPTTCEFQKNFKTLVFDSWCLIKTLLLQICSLMGEKFDYGKRGSF